MKLKFFSALMLIAVGAAQATDTLTIYTYESFTSEWGPGPVLEEKFEVTCECDVKFVGLEDGVSLLNRLRLEGDQTEADVILGLDDGLVAEAKKLDVLAEHRVNLNGLTLPYSWKDNVFVPYDFGHFAFVYDDTRVEYVPTSLRELVESSDVSIIYQDPRISTPGQGLMLWMKSVFGSEASDAWKKLQQKTVTVTPGWSEAYSLFQEGKSDMVLSYVTSPAYHLTWEDTDKFKAAEFSEGHYVQIEVAAAIKSSKNAELAQSFLAFLISKPAQDVFASTNWMWPVLATAEKPEAYSQLIQPTTLYFRSEDVADNRRDWIREWRSAASQ
jgi:thiamine transport system substrate-binding protein